MKRKNMFRILASTFFFGLAFFILTAKNTVRNVDSKSVMFSGG